MIELIEKVLRDNKDRQLNLSSRACRLMLAREIAKNITLEN